MSSPGRPSKLKFRPNETHMKSYRSDFVRKKMLEKSFKGNEKGFKSLCKLPETIHSGLEVLWRQGLMCDVKLITPDRKRLSAHRVVLATCSDYFYDLFNETALSNDTGEIEVEELAGNILDMVLEALYTGRIKIEAKNVDDLLNAGNVLGIQHILDVCESFLLEHVTKDNCLHLLETSMKYGLSRLTDVALEIAAKNFKAIIKKPLFKRLPIDHLIPMLKRDDLEVENELEVFHSVIVWLNEDKSNRIQHAGDVLSTIRLPLLSPAEVVDNVERCGYLMDVGECQRLVKEALHYHLIPSRQCLLQSPRTVPRKKAELCLVSVGGSHRLNTDPVSDCVMRLDDVTNKWEDVTTLPEPRHHHAVAVLNGFLYVAGGDISQGECDPVNTVFRYDPRQNTWLQVASMNRCRQSFQMAVMNGTIYAVGGRASQTESLSSVERYDPSRDQWDQVAPITYARRCVALCNYGGKLYAVGGSSERAVSSRAEKYSNHDNKWETLKPIAIPRFFSHLIPYKDHLHLVGGATIDDKGEIVCIPEIERFSIAHNQWTILTEIRTPRSEFACTHNKEKIYILGGYNWNSKERPRDVECYDLDTNCWTVLPEMERPVTGTVAAILTLYRVASKETDASIKSQINATCPTFRDECRYYSYRSLSSCGSTRIERVSGKYAVSTINGWRGGINENYLV